MTKPVLIAFLKETDYEQTIENEYQEDYLEELCKCSVLGIPVEEYIRFIGENPTAKGNVKELAEWETSYMGRNTEAEDETEAKDGDKEDEAELLRQENEFLTSQYQEEKCKVDQMAEDLKKAKEEEEAFKKEAEKLQKTIDSLETDKKRLQVKIDDLQLSLNENLIEHSVIEKKKFHEVPVCWSDVEFATFLFERERRLTKEQRGFVFECFNRKIPHRIIWQNVSAGYDVDLMRNLVDLAMKEEKQKEEDAKMKPKKQKTDKKKRHLFSGREAEKS